MAEETVWKCNIFKLWPASANLHYTPSWKLAVESHISCWNYLWSECQIWWILNHDQFKRLTIFSTAVLILNLTLKWRATFHQIQTGLQEIMNKSLNHNTIPPPEGNNEQKKALLCFSNGGVWGKPLMTTKKQVVVHKHNKPRPVLRCSKIHYSC